MLKALKADLAGQPENQALKEQIRILDLELRQKYMCATGVCRRGRRAAAGRDRGAAGGGHVGGHLAAEIAPAAAAGLRPRPPGGVDATGPLGGRRRGRGAGCRGRGVDRPLRSVALASDESTQGDSPVFGPGTTRRVAAANIGTAPFGRGNRPRLAAIPRTRRRGHLRLRECVRKLGRPLGQEHPLEDCRCRCPATIRRWSGAIASFSPGPMRSTARSIASTQPTASCCGKRKCRHGAGSSQLARSATTWASRRPPWRPTAVWPRAVFANGDVAAFDFQGELVWSHSLGVPENSYGHAASLVIFHDLLLVPMDQGHAGSRKLEAPGAGRGHGEDRLAAARASAQLVVLAHRDPCRRPRPTHYDRRSLGHRLRIRRRRRALAGEVPHARHRPFAGLRRRPGLRRGRARIRRVAAIAADGQGDVSKSKVLWKGEDGPARHFAARWPPSEFVFLLASSAR